MCLLVVVIDTFTCLFFLYHSRKEQEEELKKLGSSLVVLLANDTEVYSAITYSQPAFLDNPFRMLLKSDRDEEVGYWRVMNTHAILSEGKASWNGVPWEEIPSVKDSQIQNTPCIQRIKTRPNETFFDFSIPVFERQFSEEAFATQLLGEDKLPSEVMQKTLGFVQIGLSTRRINERLHEIIQYGVIPMALGIFLGGICITFVLNKHIVTPLRRLAGITLEVAKGDIGRTVDIRSKDEIGQLSMNFNQMTRSLEKSYEELESRVHERTIELLQANKLLEEEISGHKKAREELKITMEELRQAKDYAENLIETANVMIVGLDTTGNIQVFNEAAEKITGYKKPEALGKNCFATLMPPSLSPDAWQVFQTWRTTGQTKKSYENPILTKSGNKRFISWQVSEVQGQGKAAGIISFGNDITGQKQMTALVERLRLMSFIGDVSVALSGGAMLNDILRACVEAIVHNLDAALARIWIFNEKDNALELRASAGISARIDGDYSRVPVGKLMVGLVARERQPYVSNALEDDPHVNETVWVRKEGIAAFLGHPLIFSGRLVGVVAMFSRKPLDDFTIKALSHAADIISLGIDRKQAEESLRANENKYRTLLENLPQRVFYKDKELRYVSCNQNYAGDLSIASDEIAGKTDYDFYPRELAEKYRTDDRRVLESKQVEDFEEKYIVRGREMFIHTVKTPVKNAQGDVIGILGVYWDITEKVALQMESVRTRHLVSLGELAAGVAHEINNPINGIINCAQILIDKSSAGSEDNDLASRVVKEGNRIANIVSSLLSFARPSDGMERMQCVNLDEALAETLTLVAAQLKKENIVLKVNMPQNVPAVTACPQQIQQVFLNIISNARYALCQKYPNSHTDKMLEVIVEEGVMNGVPCVRAIFYDHGVGIPASIMDKVKDPFFTSKPRGKGTGLGLSISHSIISDHGGKLLIESIEGEFTKVAVVLPAVS